jgi:chromosome segregation ATPase
LVQSDEELRTYEQLARKLRQERAQWIELGPASAGDVPAHQKRIAILDAEIASCDANIRMARARVQEARQRLGGDEQAIGVARSGVISLKNAIGECERLSARARDQVAMWESQSSQKRAELASAQATLASLLGVAVDELDEQFVEPAPAPPVEPVALPPSPRLKPSPRMVSEAGVIRWFDDATGIECTADGTPLVN